MSATTSLSSSMNRATAALRIADGWYHVRHGAVLASSSILMRAFHRLLAPDVGPPPARELACLRRRYLSLLEADLRDAADGVYPRSLIESPLLSVYARAAPALLADIPRILSRGHKHRSADLPDDVDPSRYPAYYLRTFHWQTDGWLSRRSARVYDLGVEAMFGGTADVMRRRAIAPLVEALSSSGRPRVLDVGCGTGRLLGQLRAAMPRATLYGVDLSQPYLTHAREMLGDDDAINLVRENAEALPFAGGSFDAAVSVYLFHELPRDARRNVAREVLRVLPRGGRFVIVDADQTRASPELATLLANFPRVYHEPYFRSYLQDALEDVLTDVGFTIERTADAFLSRVVVARVP